MTASKIKTILLVEDDSVDVLALRRAINMHQQNFRLLHAENGREAMALLTIETPDLILLDIQMPQMNGRDTLIRIKQDDRLKEIPLIIMSISDNPDDIDFCRNNDCDDYLIKPMDITSSAKMLVDVIESRFGAYAEAKSPLADTTDSDQTRSR